ncbi:GTPase IMAP family member 4 [Garra rufa]|uniref:GTPase IMAP family member 4 n=1 Tax=Garra rufa TaxID=137080 RepID=UPI003CCEBF95
MATESPQGGSPAQPELRIVILGNAGEDKDNLVKSVVSCENLTPEKDGLCTLYKCEQAGRKIRVVEAPGWDRLSIPDRTKEEIVRSVSLCHPGPHALLLVLPVKTPSSEEIKAAEMHMKLLSERVWRHTIMVFACDEGVEKPAIKEHDHSLEKILEKCGGRSYVLQKSTCESPTQIQGLLKKIDDLVEENCGDFFIPQAYYELIQQKTQAAPGETELRHRRGSLQKNPPALAKDKGDDKGDSEEKKETVETAKDSKDTSKTSIDFKQKISMDLKQLVLILMGTIGALLGSVAGAENGVRGSFIGIIIGIFVGVLVASFTMYIYNNLYPSTDSKQPTQSAS